MRYIALAWQPDSVRVGEREATVRLEDEVLIVELQDGDEEETLALTSAGSTVYLAPPDLDRWAAESVAAASPLARSDVTRERASSFITRVNEDHVVGLPAGVAIAGRPGEAPPINYVGHKSTARYLSMNHPPGDEAYSHGHLREFETYWEPLGWALDEWIDTLSMAPFEDTVHSGIDVSSGGTRHTAAGSGSRDEARAEVTSSSAADEELHTAISAEVRTRGWSASLSKPTLGAPANPLLALLGSLTGAAELGYESAGTTMSGAVGAGLRNQVVSRLEQATGRERDTNNRSLANEVNAWREQRRLRAIRNLGEGRTQNLALYSIARQWKVTTVEAPARPVVLIRAHDLERPFTAADVFVHREALDRGLLDRELAGALTRSAATLELDEGELDPPASASAAPMTATRAVGRLAVGDPGRGRGSVIKVSALIETDDGDQEITVDVNASREATVDFELSLDADLSRFGGWRFEFVNPRLKWDRRASITPFDVRIECDEDEPLAVDLPGPIVLSPGVPKAFGRGFDTPRMDVPDPAVKAQRSRELRRVLTHLEANRAYYRLLIDLLADPVIRFARLLQRRPRPPMPADMQPVGIAGNHLAFLVEGPGTSKGDDERPDVRVLSTAAGGTFVEVIEGKTAIARGDETEDLPKVALEPNATLPWPSPIDLPEVEDGAAPTEPDAAQAPEAPAPPTAQLVTQLTEVMKGLDTLKAAVDALKPEALPAATEEDQAKPENPEAGA